MSTTQGSPATSPGERIAADVESALGTLGSRVLGLVALVGIAFGVVAFRAWLEERDDRTKMQATIASQGTLIAAAEKREQDRAQQLADTLKQIADLKKSVQTPQQVIREIPQLLPNLPQPIEPIAPSPAAAGAAGAQGTPSKAGEVEDVRVPAADLKPLFDFAQDCRACQAKLTATQQDLKDEQTKNTSLTTERDAAVKAAKGGSVWTRTVRAVKWLAVGFAVGYAVHATVR